MRQILCYFRWTPGANENSKCVSIMSSRSWRCKMKLAWVQHAQLHSDLFLILFKILFFNFDLFCFMFVNFSISLIFSTSLLVLFFRIVAEARTRGQMLTVSTRLMKTFSRPVRDWNELVGGANWPRNTLQWWRATRVKRDPPGRVEPAQKLIDHYAVTKSAA